MTIRELYEWAIKKGVEDADLIIRDIFGSTTKYVKPFIVRHNLDGTEYIEVELYEVQENEDSN